MNDLWTWVWRSAYEDESKRQWFNDWRQAMALDDTDPASAVTLLDAAISRAENAGDGWWKLFLEHWKLQILLNKARDFGAALDCAARATLEVRQGQFDDFPQRACLHEDLISAYHGLDPLGYAALIQNALDYMQSSITPGLECEACHRGLCAEFYRSTEDPRAMDAAWEYLAISDRQQTASHSVQAHLQLCHSLAALEGRKARELFSELATNGLNLVIKAQFTEGLHESLMYCALAARWNSHPEAMRALNRARETRARYGAAARPGYHLAAVLFHEENGDLEKAVTTLDEELAEIEGRSEFWREATRRLKKCELLREMGLAYESEVLKVRATMRQLKNTTLLETRLGALN